MEEDYEEEQDTMGMDSDRIKKMESTQQVGVKGSGLKKQKLLQTAPISIQQELNSKKLKVKESKLELKQYIMRLERVLTKSKQRYLELEKDHEFLNKCFIKELKKAEQLKGFYEVIKKTFGLLINENNLCTFCSKNNRMVELGNLITEYGNLNQILTSRTHQQDTSVDIGEMSFNGKVKGY